jgi:hypothetical protein
MITDANKPNPYRMRILSSLVSIFYIAAIFILAGSPVVQTLSKYNPYSLLHIPLYGILTLLLVFSTVPMPRGLEVGSIQPGGNAARRRSRGTAGLTIRLFVAGAIALVVGVFDEVHQLSVPIRDASVGDVVLDMVGIAIALLLCFWFFKTRWFSSRSSSDDQQISRR